MNYFQNYLAFFAEVTAYELDNIWIQENYNYGFSHTRDNNWGIMKRDGREEGKKKNKD